MSLNIAVDAKERIESEANTARDASEAWRNSVMTDNILGWDFEVNRPN
jgi:hypothetical protein